MVTQHANQFGHDIDFDHASVVDKAHDCHKILFSRGIVFSVRLKCGQ